MKKGLFLLLCFVLMIPAFLFSQTIDSIAIKQELDRINQTSDSLTRAQIARDSLILEKGVSLPFQPDNEEEKPNEKEEGFDKIMKLQDNEQKIRRNRTLLLIAGLIIILASMRAIINREKRKKLNRKKI